MHIKRPQHTAASAASAAIGGAARDLRIGIAVSAYHGSVTGAMRAAAEKTFADAGGDPLKLEVVQVPGAFELIAAGNAFARREDIDAVVALGCIITGETTHDQYIAQAVAHGIAHSIVETGVPIAFGVLTCQSLEQARERAGGGKGNKGEEAMLAAIESVRAIRSIAEHSGASL